MSAARRIGGLDVLRGAAVALVVLRHAWPGVFPGAGTVGVTVFFTLSGYLITGMVHREITRTGGLRVGRFYRDRALRLAPALLLLLAVFAVVETTIAPLGHPGQVPATVVVALLYLVDVPRLPVLGLDHLWTLAVEEQFYLLWPAVLVVAVRRARVGTLVVVALVGWLVVCSGSLLVAPGGSLSVYSLPTTWAVTLLVGAALALYPHRLPRVPGPLALVPVAVLAALAFSPMDKRHALTYLVGGPLVAVATAACIVVAVQGRRVPRVLAPLRWLGTVSYATYLWNFLVIQWLHAGLGQVPAAAWLSLPLSVGAAVVSWQLVERPALQFKQRLATRPQPSAAEGGAARAPARSATSQSP